MKTTGTSRGRHLLIFALAIAFAGFIISNLIDNLFVAKACTPQAIILLSCGALGIAGATPIGLLAALLSALAILALATSYGYLRSTGSSKSGPTRSRKR